MKASENWIVKFRCIVTDGRSCRNQKLFLFSFDLEVAILNAKRARLLTGSSRTQRQKQIASFSFPGMQPNSENPATCPF